ncbi:uncharacterized protein LOC129925936 [Biomphalaria glabrata]|uniref:Uncharacterized protein LOC129925936 n=1 Tax=Biomphalaria glabrata TaxID=6526 RepID=A0A9W3A8M4_BIOGL|nr:uncharacterized protein LOC129925936 [Biomphalaria glabrata]
MVRQFQDNMQARVQDSGDYSKPFPVSNGVKQGCVLAPTLFSIIFTAMPKDAFCTESIGAGLRYRTHASIYGAQRLKARTKVKYGYIRNLLFANACKNFGLTINVKKKCCTNLLEINLSQNQPFL